jgi:hypothetical protein
MLLRLSLDYLFKQHAEKDSIKLNLSINAFEINFIGQSLKGIIW